MSGREPKGEQCGGLSLTSHIFSADGSHPMESFRVPDPVAGGPGAGHSLRESPEGHLVAGSRKSWGRKVLS
jgi:hypothetical protein